MVYVPLNRPTVVTKLYRFGQNKEYNFQLTIYKIQMILDDTSTLIFKLYNIVYNHVYIGKQGDLVTIPRTILSF